MASELRVNTLKDAAGNNSIATSFVAGGSAKCWVNFNGTGTAATRDSFNLSSLTDNATGDFTISFSSSFSNNDYAVGGTTRSPGVISGGSYQAPADSDSDQATGSLRAYTITLSSGSLSVADLSYCYPSLQGDLA